MSSKTETDIDQQTKLQSAYPWIDNNLFNESLKMDFPTENVVVKNYCLKAALTPGENYSSQMIRAKVNYTVNDTNRQINFIIKAQIVDEGLDEKIANERKGVFKKEIAAYNEVLQKVHDLLKSIGDKSKLYGRCYATNIEKPYLIFEDLCDKGFQSINRRNGLDVTHYKLVLSVLAKYHAATAVLIEKEPSLKTSFADHFITSGEVFMRKMLTNFVITQMEFCKTQPGLEELSEKFVKIKDKIFDRIRNSCVRDDNDFNVILHGDLWSNNIMFKYDENGQVEDTVLVDFQICYYGPPVLDVTYCLYTSSNNGVSESDFDTLAKHYYDELDTTLRKFNYTKNCPSLSEFNVQLLKRGWLAAYVGIICESGRFLENVGENGVTIFLNDDEETVEKRLKMLLNPVVKDKIVKLLKYFDQRGYYEINEN